MTEKIRVGILFGGRSSEHEVSLMSATSVLAVLDAQKYEVTPIGITRQGQWFTGENVLEALKKRDFSGLTRVALIAEPGNHTLYTILETGGKLELTPSAELDVVFPVLHGPFGEDGTLQGLFEVMDLAYVGAGVLGSSVGMDKALFKDVLRAHNLPVVPSKVFTLKQIESDLDAVLRQAEEIADYPLFTKPVNLGSSVGISKCHNAVELRQGILEAARYDRRVLVEKGINAREIEVSVLGNDDPQASAPGEIVPSDEFYTYAAKYLDGKSQLIIPAELDMGLINRIRSLAVEAFTAADCAGMARVDFLLDRDTHDIYINEVNTIPGFTQISMYSKLWEASGLPYAQLVDHLIRFALERRKENNRTKHRAGNEG